MRCIHAATAGLALSLAAAMAGPGVANADPHTRPASTGQPIDYVIQRAVSQRGVPYVYGGGDASGPTPGARPDTGALPGGAGTLPGHPPVTGIAGLPGPGYPPGGTSAPGTAVLPGAAPAGFDASGLIQYAFAGAGIKMPRTSGEQCGVGRRVAPAQARRGDLICYGPGGSQSVALYLGNGQMIEGTNPAVTISPARTSNMVPYLVRIIES